MKCGVSQRNTFLHLLSAISSISFFWKGSSHTWQLWVTPANSSLQTLKPGKVEVGLLYFVVVN